MPVTIFFIFVLLYTAFNSIKYAALILANVPFATIGGLLALFVTGQYLSVPSAIGFIAVFGVAMLNGIVLVSFLNELRDKGLSVREAVVQGTALRLRPVLMTASVAILGLVPMLLSSGVGAETQRPLATVVVGGLISSTLLTLILLPVLYEWLENRADRGARAGGDAMKQIKAFVHRNRVSDLIHALAAAGFQRLSLFDVKGLLQRTQCARAASIRWSSATR